jgi:hypothetical protein
MADPRLRIVHLVLRLALLRSKFDELDGVYSKIPY